MLLENEPLQKLRSTAYWKSATEVQLRWLAKKAQASGCHRQATELTSGALMRIAHCVCVCGGGESSTLKYRQDTLIAVGSEVRVMHLRFSLTAPSRSGRNQRGGAKETELHSEHSQRQRQTDGQLRR